MTSDTVSIDLQFPKPCLRFKSDAAKLARVADALIANGVQGIAVDRRIDSDAADLLVDMSALPTLLQTLNEYDWDIAGLLRNAVDQLIYRRELALAAGMVTVGRANSTIAHLMVANSFDDVIRHVQFARPLHDESEPWARILASYGRRAEQARACDGPIRILWSSHGARLTRHIFADLSARTQHVAFVCRNPVHMFSSAIEGRVLNEVPFGGDLASVIRNTLRTDGSSGDYEIVERFVDTHMKLHRGNLIRYDQPISTSSILDAYAATNSRFESWSQFAADARSRRDYRDLSDLLELAYYSLAPSDPHLLPSSKEYPSRCPFVFSEHCLQHQIEFLKIRQEQGLPVEVIESTAIRTTEAIRARFAASLGLSPDSLVVTNIQSRVSSDFIITDHLTGPMVLRAKQSNALERPNRMTVPLANFPNVIRGALERELVLYGELLASKCTIGPSSLEEVHTLLRLDCLQDIGVEMAAADDRRSLLHVDPTLCFAMTASLLCRTDDQRLVRTLARIMTTLPRQLGSEIRLIAQGLGTGASTASRVALGEILERGTPARD